MPTVKPQMVKIMEVIFEDRRLKAGCKFKEDSS